MMQYPENLLYSKDHAWVREDDEALTVGITDYAQQQLGDVVYVGLPIAGKEVEAGALIASLESIKAVSDVYAPRSGRIEGANEDLVQNPERVNEDPFGAGWIATISPSGPGGTFGPAHGLRIPRLCRRRISPLTDRYPFAHMSDSFF